MTGKAFRAARERAGQTQKQFAIHFGVGRSTIAGWEDRGTPRVGTAILFIERVLADLAVQRAKGRKAQCRVKNPTTRI